MTQYLSVEDLIYLCRRADIGPIRDVGLLESAAARAASTVFGAEAYPTLELKAAALLQSLCKNHPLVDGNKRIALYATSVFLWCNDLEIALTDDQAFELVMDVAAGHIDVDAIADVLKTQS